MNLSEAIRALYPDATPEDFRLQDDQDGTGPYVAAWHAAKLGPFPEPGALAAKAAEIEAATPPSPEASEGARAVVLEPHPKLRAAAADREERRDAVMAMRAAALAARVAAEAAEVARRQREHRLAALDQARRAAEAMRRAADEAAAMAKAQGDEASAALAEVERLAAGME